MKNHSLLVLLLVCLFDIANVTLAQVSVFKQRGPKVCTEIGPLCETCMSQISCVQKYQNGQYIYAKDKVMQTCKSNEWCSDKKNNKNERVGCVSRMTNPDPYCDEIADVPVLCHQAGIFPHIYYCDKYVLCIQETSGLLKYVEQTCDPGFSYNSKTKTCDLPIQPGSPCETNYPLVTCTGSNANGTVKNERGVYYKCEREVYGRLIPDLYRCLGNLIWKNGNCGTP